jgi:ubiquinone/menaquinone biosynthesis C-methylase UbiE
MSLDFLSYKFEDTPAFINTFDEAPLWSASFGLLLLKHLGLKPGLTVLDIGSGAGFPLLELAQRLGDSCTCYGLDPWVNANARANEKIANYGVKQVKVIEGSAAQIPFADRAISLIVSNLGLNNFDEPEKVFAECCRVLAPDGRLALTTNLNGHWHEFYEVFEMALKETGHSNLIAKLKEQQVHRGSVESISSFFTGCGLSISAVHRDEFTMHFLDGSAFLNHYFIKLGWLSSWLSLVPQEHHTTVFTKLEENLNALAARNGALKLTVPMAYIEGVKG